LEGAECGVGRRSPNAPRIERRTEARVFNAMLKQLSIPKDEF